MLLHLSDLHFGTEQQACIEAIQQFCVIHSPEAVIISGDLTQRAHYKQFFACRQFLDSLKLPYLTVPGNHDIPLYHLWNRLFSPFARYRLFFGDLETTLETQHFYIIGVNSIRRRYHTRGHISLAQIQAIQHRLKHAPVNKIKLIVAHQPFYTPPDDPHSIKDCPMLGRLALDVWSKNGLNGLLHGHLHQSAVYDLNQIYHLGAKHPVLDIHAGTATSSRLHRGLANSFNIIHTSGTVDQYVFDQASQLFLLNTNST